MYHISRAFLWPTDNHEQRCRDTTVPSFVAVAAVTKANMRFSCVTRRRLSPSMGLTAVEKQAFRRRHIFRNSPALIFSATHFVCLHAYMAVYATGQDCCRCPLTSFVPTNERTNEARLCTSRLGVHSSPTISIFRSRITMLRCPIHCQRRWRSILLTAIWIPISQHYVKSSI